MKRCCTCSCQVANRSSPSWTGKLARCNYIEVLVKSICVMACCFNCINDCMSGGSWSISFSVTSREYVSLYSDLECVRCSLPYGWHIIHSLSCFVFVCFTGFTFHLPSLPPVFHRIMFFKGRGLRTNHHSFYELVSLMNVVVSKTCCWTYHPHFTSLTRFLLIFKDDRKTSKTSSDAIGCTDIIFTGELGD